MPRRTKPYLIHASFRPEAEIDFDSYPFCISAVKELANIDFHPNVTFFVGENGSGKSSLIVDALHFVLFGKIIISIG